jgi:hypothetical protein
MITAFWSGLAGKVAERAVLTLTTAAFAFWMVGFLAWLTTTSPASRQARFTALAAAGQLLQLLTVVVAVIVVVGSGVIVQRLASPTLLILQGHWPRILAPLRDRLVSWHFKRKEQLETQWQELFAEVDADQPMEPSTADRLRLARAERALLNIEQRLNAYPPRSERVAPTRMGNALAATEGWVVDKYGLDAARCWPVLWLLLPDGVRKDVAEARKALDDAALGVVWSVLLLIWTPLAWWVAVLAAAAFWISYLATVQAAQLYGELIDAAYTVHRGLLYDKVGWPHPAPAAEPEWGRALTTLIFRGPALAVPPT